MQTQKEEMRKELQRIFDAFPSIHTADIPGIDLYMDQVTTFLQDNLQGVSRDPVGDKFLTKTMINNYVKNKVLMPPVKKKYSREHMMLLIMIYYMKSFLSIGDIRSITAPVMEQYVVPTGEHADRKRDAADKKAGHAERKNAQAHGSGSVSGDPAAPSLRIADIYEEIARSMDENLPHIQDDIDRQISLSAEDFSDVPEEERALLQRFSLICRLSSEVYMRKLFIEKLLDSGRKI